MKEDMTKKHTENDKEAVRRALERLLYDVQVWFAWDGKSIFNVPQHYETVYSGLSRDHALEVARTYTPGALGVCIVHAETGCTEWVKRPTGCGITSPMPGLGTGREL